MSHVVSADIVVNVLPISVGAEQRVGTTAGNVMLESMKMEIPVSAEMAGIVPGVVVTAGGVIHNADPLAVIAEAR